MSRQLTRRHQTAPQEGLVIRLLSGRARAAANASFAIRRTTLGGVQNLSSIVGGAGVPPARYDESTDLVTCPGVDGSPPITLGGTSVFNVPTTWFPLDRVEGVPIDRLFKFTRPPGSFGRPFPVKRVVKEKGPFVRSSSSSCSSSSSSERARPLQRAQFAPISDMSNLEQACRFVMTPTRPRAPRL